MNATILLLIEMRSRVIRVAETGDSMAELSYEFGSVMCMPFPTLVVVVLQMTFHLLIFLLTGL